MLSTSNISNILLFEMLAGWDATTHMDHVFLSRTHETWEVVRQLPLTEDVNHVTGERSHLPNFRFCFLGELFKAEAK